MASVNIASLRAGDHLGVAITPYADRLRALQEAERIHKMMSNAA